MPRARAAPLPQPVFDEPVFAQGRPTPDPAGFSVPHPSDSALYQKIQSLLHDEVVGVPASRAAPGDLYELATALGPHGPELVAAIQAAGHITFHAVGDIGASTAGKYPGELRVSDRVTEDVELSPGSDRPQFLYLLGDVVYDFGQSAFYFDEFYEPYRNYPAPIFAIPGNHDSFIVPGTPAGQEPLTIFQRNFCATEPTVTPEAGSLHRTAMTQPGVYFALDAPFVRILGLFSNALEDPGVISSENGEWTAISDVQLGFLSAQLARIRAEGFAGALLFAVHHPPFCYSPPAGAPGGSGPHGGSPAMLAQIDAICQQEGVYPHAVLAGHSHNYQRFTRSIRWAGGTIQVPFIVSGSGGHNVSRLVRGRAGAAGAEPTNGMDVSYLDEGAAVPSVGLVLDRHDDSDHGYLRISASPSALTINFCPAGSSAAPAPPSDTVSVDLATRKLALARDGAVRRRSARPTSSRTAGRGHRRT